MKPVIIIAIAFVLLIPISIQSTYGFEPYVIDQSKEPQYYVDRYINDSGFKEWFDQSYPYTTIYDAVGIDDPTHLKIPASFVDKSKDPQSYVDRYKNELIYKEWFDENYSEYNSIYEAVGLENPADEILQVANAQYHFGYVKEAFDNYEKALSIDSSNKEAQQGKDESYNKIQEIEEYLESELSLIENSEKDEICGRTMTEVYCYDRDTYFDLTYADYYQALKKPDLALSYANKVNPLEGGDDTFFWLIQVYSNNNAPQKVLDMHNMIKGYAPPEIKSWLNYLKVKSLWKQEKFEEAEIFVKDNDAYDSLRKLIDHGRYGDLGVNNALVKAIIFEKNGNVESAIEYYGYVTNAKYPTTIDPRMLPANISNEKRDSILYGTMITDKDIVEGKTKFYQHVQDFKELEKMIPLLSNELKKEITQEIEYAKILNLYGESSNDEPSSKSSVGSSSSSEIICGTGTIEKNGQCVVDTNYKSTSKTSSKGGGCLIATATYGSELAPQVQQLREIRDNSLLSTELGTNFMNSFNDVYYSFSPIIADYERENPVFREMVKIAITPMITSLSILNYVDMDSEAEVLGYGISLIILNGMMYVGIPAIIIMKIRR